MGVGGEGVGGTDVGVGGTGVGVGGTGVGGIGVGEGAGETGVCVGEGDVGVDAAALTDVALEVGETAGTGAVGAGFKGSVAANEIVPASGEVCEPPPTVEGAHARYPVPPAATSARTRTNAFPRRDAYLSKKISWSIGRSFEPGVRERVNHWSTSHAARTALKSSLAS